MTADLGSSEWPINMAMEAPRVHFVCCGREGWYCGTFSLAQFARARATMERGLDILWFRLAGSLV